MQMVGSLLLFSRGGSPCREGSAILPDVSSKSESEQNPYG